MRKFIYVVQRSMVSIPLAAQPGINMSFTDFKVNRKVFDSKENASIEAVRMAQDCVATYGLCLSEEDIAKVTMEKAMMENGFALTGRVKDGDLYVITIKILTCMLERVE